MREEGWIVDDCLLNWKQPYCLLNWKHIMVWRLEKKRLKIIGSGGWGRLL